MSVKIYTFLLAIQLSRKYEKYELAGKQLSPEEVDAYYVTLCVFLCYVYDSDK